MNCVTHYSIMSEAFHKHVKKKQLKYYFVLKVYSINRLEIDFPKKHGKKVHPEIPIFSQ